VTGANGCSSMTSVTIIEDTMPPGAYISDAETITCNKPVITLSGEGDGTFLWSTGATTSTIDVTSPGTFTLTVTGANGCVSVSSPVFVGQDTTPPSSTITNATGTTVLSCVDPVIYVSVPAGELSYSWSDGVTVVGTTPFLGITVPGTYTVTVTANNGCTSTSSIEITGTECSTTTTTTTAAP